MMKKLSLLLVLYLLLGCNKSDDNNNCNFLLNVGVNLTVNINLPQFSQLQFANNPVRVEGQGNEGLILIRGIGENILAWDGADPNHSPGPCSALQLNGIDAECGCDDGNIYNLVTGQLVSQTNQPCTLKPYRVESLGNNTFLVTN
jgi:hypothetical protein